MQASSCQTTVTQPEAISLMVAVKKSKSEKVRAYLHQGADPNIKDPHGSTSLHWACYCDTKGVITDTLLKAGALPNVQDNDGRTPLHYAVGNKHIAIKLVEMLLDAGALPNVQDNDGRTPLHLATQKDVIVQLLLQVPY